MRGCAAALLLGSLLSACSPDLDWRELNSAEGGFQVLMPGRASLASAPTTGDATMTMWTAETSAALFGAGYTDYSDDARMHIDASRDGLARNVRGKIVEDRDLGNGDVMVRAVSMEGMAPGGSARIVHAQFHASGHRLYQLAVIAKPGTLSETDLETFFTSFKQK